MFDRGTHNQINVEEKKISAEGAYKQEYVRCPDCSGNGYHLYDTYDHRGEHVQYETKCGLCHGEGDVEAHKALQYVALENSVY